MTDRDTNTDIPESQIADEIVDVPIEGTLSNGSPSNGSPSNGSPSNGMHSEFRMPDGPPPGTLARGALAAATEVSTGKNTKILSEADIVESNLADDKVGADWPENRYNYPADEMATATTDAEIMQAADPAAPQMSFDKGPPAPPDVTALATPNDEPHVPTPYDDNAPHRDREMDLVEHLTELRKRLLYSVSAILIAMMVTWQITPQIQALIIRPVTVILKQYKISGMIQTIEPTEAFMIYFNISLISAVIITIPFLLFQAWRFIEPAMTKRERRFTGILVPFSSLLFFMGCALGYATSPIFFQFFAQFQPPGTMANYSFASVAVLLGKMLLVFGACFQVPVITIFLNKSGLVSRDVLIEYWRHVVVVVFIVVAVLTPTWDPVTMTVCALPPCFLYGFSIWLVRWI